MTFMHAERVRVVGRTRGPAILWGLTVAAILGGWPQTAAHAQKVILLPVAAADLADPAAKVAQAAVADALGMQGLKVLPWEVASKQLPAAELARCGAAPECAPRLMQAAAADLTAGVVVAHNAQQVAEKIRVALLDTEKHTYEGEATVENGDVRGATTRALLEARSFQLLGPGPWLRVEGTPEGAEVLLDDRVVGRLPYRASINPGVHELRVREAGYAAFERKLDVPQADAHRSEVIVALEPEPIATSDQARADLRAVSAGEDQAGSGRSSTWLVWPIVVGGVGVVLAGVTSVRLATGLDYCVQPDERNRCMARRTVNWVPTVLAYSVSAALIGTSVVWIIAGSNEQRPALAAKVGLDYVALTGSF